MEERRFQLPLQTERPPPAYAHTAMVMHVFDAVVLRPEGASTTSAHVESAVGGWALQVITIVTFLLEVASAVAHVNGMDFHPPRRVIRNRVA